MDIEYSAFITEEAVIKNGTLYNVTSLQPWGYNHLQLWAVEGETIDELIAFAKDTLNVDTIDYIPNTHIVNNRSNYQLDESICVANKDSALLMQQLTEIEKLDMIELTHLSTNDCRINYYPRYMIYEINNMAVKLPKQVIFNTGETETTYEYLIYPNFSLNEDLLNELRQITGKPLPVNIEGKMANQDGRGFHRLFSTELYKQFYIGYFQQCEVSKGVTNAVRNMEFDRIVQDGLYGIYQKFRAHKKDSISYTGYEFYGPLKELRLSELAEQVGMTMTDIGIISQSPVEREKFLQEHEDDPKYTAVVEYIRTLNLSPTEAMSVYHEMEKTRCYFRKLIYQLNMGWYDDFPGVINFLNTVQPSCKLDVFESALDRYIFWLDNNIAWGVQKCYFDGKRRHRK